MLDQEHPDLHIPQNDHNAYTLGSIGEHNVVIACLPKGEIGNNSAAHVATQTIDTFPPIRLGLMVGISRGIPPEVRLGDIVVSTPIGAFPGVVQWDFGKAVDGSKFERTGSLDRLPKKLLTALTKLEAEQNKNGSKKPQFLEDLKNNPNLPSKYTRSDSLKDILFAPDNHHRSRHTWGVIFSIVWATILTFFMYLLGLRAFALVERGTEEVKEVTNSTACTEVDAWRERAIEDNDEEKDNCRFCDMTRVIKRRPRAIRVHYGLVASGNAVIKDINCRD